MRFTSVAQCPPQTWAHHGQATLAPSWGTRFKPRWISSLTIRTRLSSESLFMLERTTTITGQSSNRVLEKLLFGLLNLGDTTLVAPPCKGRAQPSAGNQRRLVE